MMRRRGSEGGKLGERRSSLEGMGTALRMARVASGLNQEELSALSGVTQPMLSQIENGKQTPSMRTLESILDALGLSLSDLDEYLMRVQRARHGRDVAVGKNVEADLLQALLLAAVEEGTLTRKALDDLLRSARRGKKKRG